MKQRTTMEGGGAMALAERLGWMGSIDRGQLGHFGQGAEVPDIGEMVDVSVFALQDMLTIVGAYSGPKDGNWSDAVMEGLRRWNQPDPNGAARFTLTVIPKAGDPQTVGFRLQVFNALQVDAERAVATNGGGKARPRGVWPAGLTGGLPTLFLVSKMMGKKKGPVADLR